MVYLSRKAGWFVCLDKPYIWFVSQDKPDIWLVCLDKPDISGLRASFFSRDTTRTESASSWSRSSVQSREEMKKRVGGINRAEVLSEETKKMMTPAPETRNYRLHHQVKDGYQCLLPFCKPLRNFTVSIAVCFILLLLVYKKSLMKWADCST